MKWVFVVVHSHQSPDQYLVQLCSRFFMMSHFKTRGRVFSNQEDLMRTLNIQQAIGRPIFLGDEKSEIRFD